MGLMPGIGLIGKSAKTLKSGEIMYCGIYYGRLYKSIDFGQTWNSTAYTPTQGWNALACSADGKTVLALCGQMTYVSYDGGDTFTQKVNTMGSYNYGSVGMSANGQYMISGIRYVNKSNDFGATWTQALGSPGYPCLSGTGQYQYIFQNPGNVLRSTNYGASWTDIGGYNNWYGGACSYDGARVGAAIYTNGMVHGLSTSYGSPFNFSYYTYYYGYGLSLPGDSTSYKYINSVYNKSAITAGGVTGVGLAYYPGCFSYSGLYCAVKPNSGQIKVSGNGGATWSNVGPSGSTGPMCTNVFNLNI